MSHGKGTDTTITGNSTVALAAQCRLPLLLSGAAAVGDTAAKQFVLVHNVVL
jgi:hypothetical protein